MGEGIEEKGTGNKQAIALKQSTAKIDDNDVLLAVPALSAGILTITP